MPTAAKMSDINRPQSFRVDDWRAFPDANELRRNGEIQKLESRVMNLLVYLHQHRGEVVGRDELINEVWGKEALSDHSISVAVAALRRALGDEAANPRYIETVRKKGYRLIADCRDDAAPVEPTLPADAVAPVETLALPGRITARARAGLAALAAIAAGVAAFFVLTPEKPVIADGKPLVIVEDFQNATSDEALDELATVLSDLFLAELARDNRANIQRAIPNALNHSFLEGDLQAGTTATIAGQLVRDDDDLHLSIYLEDKYSSQILWSGDQIVDQEKYLGVARSLTANLLSRIAPEDSKTEDGEFAFGNTNESRPAQLVRLGQKLEAIRSDATTRAAHSLAQEALEIDPEFGPAHGLLAFLYAENGPAYWGMTGERYERASEELRLARQYGSNEAYNYVTEAWLRRARDGRPDVAARLSRRAIDLAPQDSWVLRMSIMPDIIMGDFDRALENNIKAVAHSLDPASILAERTFPLYFLGRFEETVAIYDATRALDLFPVYYGPQAAVLAGDQEKGFRLWIDLLRAHDLKITDEVEALQWIANGDVKAAYDWLQLQVPDEFSRKNMPLLRASWQMAAGDSEAAMETILTSARALYGDEEEKATPSMLWSVLQYDPLYAPLADDPRMAEIIDLVGVNKMVEDYTSGGPGGTGVAAFSSPG